MWLLELGLFSAVPATQAGLHQGLVALPVPSGVQREFLRVKYMNSGPFHIHLIAASEEFLRNCDRAFVADGFVPASVGNAQAELKKTLANTLPICGASLHPYH